MAKRKRTNKYLQNITHKTVTRVTRQVPLLDEELLTVLEHLVLSGVCVTRSLVLCVMFCRYLLLILDYNHMELKVNSARFKCSHG
jgi:hypothetical protein